VRRLTLALALLATAGPALAQAGKLTDTGVRAFVGRQELAWNKHDLKGYFAGFSPDAAFVDQALSSENKIVPYGRSTLAEARRQTARMAARSQLHEDGMVQTVKIAPDGRSALVTSQVTARITTRGAIRLSCVRRAQTVVLAGVAIQSKGQIDTVVRCGR
jgi:hypothetical protein